MQGLGGSALVLHLEEMQRMSRRKIFMDKAESRPKKKKKIGKTQQ